MGALGRHEAMQDNAGSLTCLSYTKVFREPMLETIDAPE
jgi:hypothetical protein